MRRGVVGALASGDARVRRACGAVRKGARAEAGWCRAPHARAEGFMGVRLRTFYLISGPFFGAILGKRTCLASSDAQSTQRAQKLDIRST